MFSRVLPAPHAVACAAALLAVCLTTLPASAANDAAATRATNGATYVSASRLNLRAQPATDGEPLARLKINQPLRLVRQADTRWCEVEAGSATGASAGTSANPPRQRGFVDCRYLADRPVTLADTEAESANLILALNRLALDGLAPAAYASLPWGETFVQHAAESRQLLEALFDQLERHFAISPSMRTYADYNSLLSFVAAQGSNERPLPEPITSLLGRRIALLPQMRAAFTADFAAQPAEPVRRPVTSALSRLTDARQGLQADAAPTGRGNAFDLAAPPAGRSFFSEGRWAIGWAPLVTAVDSPDKSGAVYRFHYNGSGPWAVGDAIEMAKAWRASVRTSFRYLNNDPDSVGLAQMRRTAEGVFEASTVQVSLTAWAITDAGLVSGKLRQVVFAGDACSGGAGDTAAEFVFAKPLPAVVHGVFISSAPIDAARVKVKVHKRSFLAPLLSDEDTLTSETVVEVDLNGDGVPDLRSRVSTDTSVSGWFGARARRVGGWYAYDVESLEVNDNGRWRMLSIYDVVTCT
jgi:hypothetical protein